MSMPAVGDASGSHRFTGLYTGSESQTPVGAPFLSRERVLGSWVALVGFAGCLSGACWEPEGSLRVASGWLEGAYRLATRWPEGGFRVASGWLGTALLGGHLVLPDA